MKTHWLKTVGLATCLSLAVGGCKPQPGPPQWTCPDLPLSPGLVVVLFLDRSLSILNTGEQDQLAALGVEASRLVQHLPPATRIVVRYIAERSYPDSEHAFTLDIPAVPPAVQCPPFDPRCQVREQQRQALYHCVDEARVRLAAALQNLNPDRATKTDVWGAIAAASDIFSTYPQSQGLLVVYSDLIDTVGTKLPNKLPGLANTRTLVRLVKNGDPTEIAQRLSTFSKRLATYGATVEVMPPEGLPEHSLFAQSPVVGMSTAAQ